MREFLRSLNVVVTVHAAKPQYEPVVRKRIIVLEANELLLQIHSRNLTVLQNQARIDRERRADILIRHRTRG
ncbi:hypothetical protein D3C73_1570290 [compost metagenome]